jgi:hypothetical protein
MVYYFASAWEEWASGGVLYASASESMVYNELRYASAWEFCYMAALAVSISQQSCTWKQKFKSFNLTFNSIIMFK